MRYCIYVCRRENFFSVCHCSQLLTAADTLSAVRTKRTTLSLKRVTWYSSTGSRFHSPPASERLIDYLSAASWSRDRQVTRRERKISMIATTIALAAEAAVRKRSGTIPWKEFQYVNRSIGDRQHRAVVPTDVRRGRRGVEMASNELCRTRATNHTLRCCQQMTFNQTE